jgi:two-component system, cell cycle sensor histidine kinase and response regulator CckA
MLVEDEPILARVLGMVLTSAGYDVTICDDGAVALTRFRASPDHWDVVVSDVTMPALSGDRLARALREIRPRLPVILMSGNIGRVTPRRLHAIGVAAVLEKPVTIEDLLGAVDAVAARALHRVSPVAELRAESSPASDRATPPAA